MALHCVKLSIYLNLTKIYVILCILCDNDNEVCNWLRSRILKSTRSTHMEEEFELNGIKHPYEGRFGIISGPTQELLAEAPNIDIALDYLSGYVFGDTWEELDEIRDLDTSRTLYYISEGIIHVNDSEDESFHPEY